MFDDLVANSIELLNYAPDDSDAKLHIMDNDISDDYILHCHQD